MESGFSIKLIIQTVNNTEAQISVSSNLTGFQLKQYIHDNVTKSLLPLTMKIHYAGVKIQDDKLLSSYKMLKGSKLKIIQTKCDLDQVPGLIVSYQQDQISMQDKTARMPCGHVIGRDCMTQFVRSLVQNNLYRIICPSYKPDGSRCSCEWDYALCRAIGVFTQEEILQFETGLSKNWILENTIECPKCKENLYKGGLETNRVRCPRCNYGDFCVSCCKKWIGNNNNICGNQGCMIIDELLEKSLWNKQFILKDKNKVSAPYMAPQHRACPKCHSFIEHSTGCKHMNCPVCKTSFCWICLGQKEKEVWNAEGLLITVEQLLESRKFTLDCSQIQPFNDE